MNQSTLSGLLDSCAQGWASLEPGHAPRLAGYLAWCGFGLRDPSILSDAEGRAVLDASGRLTLFFNGRDKPLPQGGETCVGVAYGSPREGWSIQPEPVFRDGSYTAQGSVLRLSADHWRMYYSADTLRGFRLASSVDGVHWQRSGPEYLLRPDQFSVRRMGLPFVVKAGGRWVMVFEGVAAGRFHIYMASSEDGVEWSPENGGKPVYLPAGGRWDSFGQANPSLCRATDPNGQESYFIFYNGCAGLHAWDIGILAAASVGGPWSPCPHPLLRRGQAGEWDAARVEGARLAYAEGEPPAVVYFGLPGEDPYAGGQIAAAEIRLQGKVVGLDHATLERNLGAEQVYNDKLAQHYFNIWDRQPIQRFTNDAESRLLAAHIGKGADVLVLGSGGGRELPVLLEQQCRLTAIDISPAMLAAGKARYPGQPIAWIQADLHALPTADASFDAAVCLGAVLNYLPDPHLCLRNILRSLRPGGQLILAVLNAEHASEPHTLQYLRDGRIRRLYRLQDLLGLLEEVGFAVADTTGLRFLVDLLPAEWNREPVASALGREILENILSEESRLSSLMGADKAKFMLVRAYAAK